MKHQTQISSHLKVEDLRIEISNLITKSKEKYYQRINAKLNDPSMLSCKDNIELRRILNCSGNKLEVLNSFSLNLHITR